MLQLPKWPPNACLQLGNYLAAVSCRVFLVDEVGIIDNLCICWKLCMYMCFVCREPTKMSHSASWCKSAALWGVDNQCFITDCNNLEIIFITQSFLICLSIITKCHILKSCYGELFLLTVQKLKILWVHVKNEMSQEKVVQTAKKTRNFEIKMLKIQYFHIIFNCYKWIDFDVITCKTVLHACGVSSHKYNFQPDVEILTCSM